MVIEFICKRRTCASALANTAVLLLLVPVHAFSGQDEAENILRFESSLSPKIHVEGDPEIRWTLEERMRHWKVPSASVAVVRDGKVAWAKGYGVLQAGRPDKVDAQTVFSVGSLSKVATAVITLRLVDMGKLDLDRNVNDYMTRWKVPENDYTLARPVTLRGILSHTAGLSVGGFKDYQPDEEVPDVVATLEGRAPAKNKPVRVEHLPGSKYKYSGGGTTVQQLIIEEVTGLGFAEAARKYLFDPLNMPRSTFENPLPPKHGNIAKAHDDSGRPRALPRGYETMPEMAASGLWTTPTEYARIVIAIIDSYRGARGSFLSAGLARQMLTEVWPSGAGLGPYLAGDGLDRRFFHSGSNASYKAYFEGHPNTGNGVVIFTPNENGWYLFHEIKQSIAVSEGWSAEITGRRNIPRIDIPSKEMEEMVGAYSLDDKNSIERVIYKDGSLYTNFYWSPTVFLRLIPIDSMRFMVDSAGYFPHVRFVRGYDGRVSGILKKDAGKGGTDPDVHLLFKKIESL